MLGIQAGPPGPVVEVAYRRTDRRLAESFDHQAGSARDLDLPSDLVDVMFDLMHAVIVAKRAPVAGFPCGGVEVSDDYRCPRRSDASELGIGRRAIGQVPDHQAAPDH